MSGKLPTGRRRLIYITSAITWLTGTAWLIFHYYVSFKDEFGFSNPHPLEKLWLIVHAAISLVVIWQFGILWPKHIKNSWTRREARRTGGSLFAAIVVLASSGVALYYIGNAEWRNAVSILHWAVGLAALAVFLLHLFKNVKFVSSRGSR